MNLRNSLMKIKHDGLKLATPEEPVNGPVYLYDVKTHAMIYMTALDIKKLTIYFNSRVHKGILEVDDGEDTVKFFFEDGKILLNSDRSPKKREINNPADFIKHLNEMAEFVQEGKCYGEEGNDVWT